ncbi:MAG: sulfatase-like hydrolase/transferase, partial [Planctomycetota bacterium]
RYYLRTGTHGVTRGRENMRAEEVTIAEVLKAAGYATSCFGKWHNGSNWPYHPNAQGFDEFVGFCAGNLLNYFDTNLEHNGTSIKTTGYISDVLTDFAITFIENNKDQPFFCYVPYNAPHSPFQVPDKYFDKYKARGLDDILACIYGMCENLDDNIGRLLKRLDDLKLTENTIVIFLTDNGPQTDRYNGDMKGRKGSVDEGGVRVPCFIRWPGRIKPGLTIEPIAAHIDLLPTLIELCAIKNAETLLLDGTSVAPLLAGSTANWPDRMIFAFMPRGGGKLPNTGSVVAGQWRAVTDGKNWEVYHTATDPEQKKNLAKKYPHILQQMRTSYEISQPNRPGSVRTQQWRAVTDGDDWRLYDMAADPAQNKDLAQKYPVVVRKLRTAYEKIRKDFVKDGFDLPIHVGHRLWPLVVLPAHEAHLLKWGRGGISYVRNEGWANDWITNWTDKRSYPWWDILVVESGRFEVTLMYTCKAENIGTGVTVIVGGQKIQGIVAQPHDPQPIYTPDRVPHGNIVEKVWAPLNLGTVDLKPCRTKLYVVSDTIRGETVMDLKAVHLKRVD